MAVTWDPTQLEIIKNSLEGIGDGMALTVVRASRSSVVRQALDFSTGLLTAQGELLAQGACLPIHMGGMPSALQACQNRYKDQIYPGDVLIVNDPYEGASHLPDVFLFKPLFVGDTLMAYACAMAHQTDIGGRVAGGNASDSTEIYQEGLRIPPLKLYQRGEPNETLFRILEKAVRVPDQVLGDIHGQGAALYYGEQEFQRLVQRYGVEELLAYQEELLNYTERITRSTIASLPDGHWSFTDYVDDDGFSGEEIPIVVNLTKKGEELHVDFTGTGPQCKGSIQPVFATTKAMVYSAVRNVLGALGADIPNTSGYFRPVNVTAEAGSFVYPLPPAPVAARNLGCVRIHQTVLGAFAQMLPDVVYACSGGCEYLCNLAGYDKSTTPWKAWIQVEFLNESAVGGFPYKDGADAQGAGSTNGATVPVEIMEVEHPLMVEDFALLPDTEGAGKFRGGLGLVRQYRYQMDDTLVQVRGDRMKHTPFGLYGGQASAPTRNTIIRGETTEQMHSKFMTQVNAGDHMRIETPGAGGWGNPLERDPELVLQDVIQEKVTPERAREVYGVVVDPHRRRVEVDATQKLRVQKGRRNP